MIGSIVTKLSSVFKKKPIEEVPDPLGLTPDMLDDPIDDARPKKKSALPDEPANKSCGPVDRLSRQRINVPVPVR